MNLIEPEPQKLSSHIAKLHVSVQSTVITLARSALLVSGAIISLLLSFFFFFMCIIFLMGGSQSHIFIMLTLLPGTASAVLAFVGYKLIMVLWKDQKAMRDLIEEQAILKAAKTKEGILSVTEVPLYCQMRIVDGERALKRLASLGICLIDVAEEGHFVYRFPSFEPKKLSNEKTLKIIHNNHRKVLNPFKMLFEVLAAAP